MRGRRHDSIALPGGRRVNDPDPPGTRVAAALQSDTGESMADDLKQTGRQDDERINPDQDHELNYWSEKLGVSRDELRKAVQAAGPMVKDVQRHLNR
jgi:hypothetical protein